MARKILLRNNIIDEHQAATLLRKFRKELQNKPTEKRRKNLQSLIRDIRAALKPLGPYERDGIFAINDIVPVIGNGIAVYNQHNVSLDCKRLKVFKNTGVKCVSCGMDGAFFALEKCWDDDSDRWHFNLYGLAGGKKEVLFTRDHIKPRAKGGTDCLENQETMCCRCNFAKGDKWEEPEAVTTEN